MIRESLQQHHIGLNKQFRFRGVEPGRLENFSDACFALAITLLLISTSPPTSFQQVKNFTWEIIPFAICITLIVLIWHQHFIFFFRYGIRNPTVVVLNGIFLVIVLFYVYPLKFLTKGILVPLTRLFGQDDLHQQLLATYGGSNMAQLMIIYGVGATSIFGVLTLFYRYALKNAEELELNDVEKFDTRTSMQVNLLMGLVPALSVVVAIIFYKSPLAGLFSGLTYFLYTPVMTLFWRKKNKARQQLVQMTNEPADLLQYP
jgi:uncharacterized membrane protein